MSFDRQQFDYFVSTLKLRHFTPPELLSRQYVKPNGPPPLTLWQNIVPTIMVLENLRATLNTPIHIICAYRNEQYNNNGNQGRDKRSTHQAYCALDFKAPGQTAAAVWQMLHGWNNTRWFGAAIPFQRKPVYVTAGPIPFGELPIRYNNKVPYYPYEFLFRGFLKLYPSGLIHLDTRGLLTGDED